MKQAVASSLRVNLECMGKKLQSLLDSGSMFSLVQQSYFDIPYFYRNIKPKLGPARGLKANVHNLFDLKGENGGDMPMRYFEMNIAFLGLIVPKVGFLVREGPQ